MRRTVKALPVAAAVALCVSTAAASAAGTFTSTVKLGKATVQSGTVTEKGTFTSNRGKGKAVLVSKGGNGSFDSNMTLTFSNGKLKLKGHTSTSGAADPAKYSIRGTWKIAGGTGKYKHATGTVSVLGTGVNDLSSAKMTLRGHVKT
jgi:hypothetical protein